MYISDQRIYIIINYKLGDEKMITLYIKPSINKHTNFLFNQ